MRLRATRSVTSGFHEAVTISPTTAGVSVTTSDDCGLVAIAEFIVAPQWIAGIAGTALRGHDERAEEDESEKKGRRLHDVVC